MLRGGKAFYAKRAMLKAGTYAAEKTHAGRPMKPSIQAKDIRTLDVLIIPM